MATLADYFSKIAYQPKYFIGDRILGSWNGIPFRGTVLNDSRPDGENPKITVKLDLPILYEEQVYNFITVKHKEVQPSPQTVL